jgi:hypothetical protein
MNGLTFRILYCGLTLGLFGVLNAYIGNSSMYRSRIERIDSNYEALAQGLNGDRRGTPVTMVIGNSYVNSSFRTELTDANVVKFVVFGMPLADLVAVVEHLPVTDRISTLVVGLGYDYANPAGGVSSVYEAHFSANPIKRAWSSLALVRGRSMSSTVFKEDFVGLFAANASASTDSDIGGNASPAGDSIDPAMQAEALEASARQRLREYQPFTSSVNNSFNRYLTRLKSACDSRNIRLVAYTAPIYGELRERLDASVLERFRSTIRDAGIRYVDLNEVYFNWSAELFADATHVEPDTGGAETTRYLLALLDDAQQRDPSRSSDDGKIAKGAAR